MTDPTQQEIVVVVTAADDGDDGQRMSDLVEQPAKVMRIGTMVKQLLEEVRAAPLDEASRVRLREIHQRSITELEGGVGTRPPLHYTWWRQLSLQGGHMSASH